MRLRPFLEELQKQDVAQGLDYYSEPRFEDVGKSISCQIQFGTKALWIPKYLEYCEFDSIRIVRSYYKDKHIQSIEAVLTIPNTDRRQ